MRIPDLPPLDAPALHAEIAATLCHITIACKFHPVLLVDRPEAQAELLPDGTLALRLGLLLQLRDEAELVFVLAHEVAHRELQHRPARSLEGRRPLEFAADARAQAALMRARLRPEAGCTLLRRLRAELLATTATAALTLIEQRIRALPACSDETAQAIVLSAALRDGLAAWRNPDSTGERARVLE